MNLRREITGWLIVAAACILIEVLFFNYRSIESNFFDEADYSAQYFEEGNGIVIELSDIKKHVDNIFLDADIYDGVMSVPTKGAIDVAIKKTDSADFSYYELPSAKIISGSNQSKYLRLHLSGESEKLMIKLAPRVAGRIIVNDIKINVHRPFQFSLLRLCVLFIIIGSFYLFRPGSVIYRRDFSINNKRQLAAVVILSVCWSVFAWGLLTVNNSDEARVTEPESTRQYEMLTKSLSEGKVYLDYDIPDVLYSIDNPYDFQSRMNTGGEYLFDIAYFNHHYYVYFGIVPVLFVFLPIYLLTGVMLKTYQVTLVFAVILIIGIAMFLYALLKRFRLHISFGQFLLAHIALIMSGGIVTLVYPGNTYSLAILSAIAFAYIGLSLWLFASDGNGRISKWMLILGSLCMALVAGCRPHIALLILISPFIFYEDIKAHRFFSKKGIGNLLSFTLPIILVAVGLMLYNYIRFDSVFEFGAKYNFTGVDMTHQASSFVKLIQGIWEYILAPISVIDRFPYMTLRDLSSDYLGYFYRFEMYGGLIWLYPISVLSVAAFAPSKRPEIKRILAALFVTACVIVIADIMLAGITARYMYDFSYIFVMVAVIVYMTSSDTGGVIGSRIGNGVISLIVLISAYIQIMSVLIFNVQYGLLLRNPDLYTDLEILFRM